jgi:FMN-dependent NADH-azoreductase
MSKLLYVISSPRGERSESRAIADEFLDAYQRSDSSLEVDVLDLWNEPLPVHGGNGVAAKMAVFAGQPCPETQARPGPR